MSVAAQQRQQWFRTQKKRSLRYERARLQGELQQAIPLANAWLVINRRTIFGRLKWALFKR